jgi:hypothetical protein
MQRERQPEGRQPQGQHSHRGDHGRKPRRDPVSCKRG